MSCKHLTGFEAQRYSDASSNGVVVEAITACGAQERLTQTSYDENSGGHVNLDAYGPPAPQIAYNTNIFGHGTFTRCLGS